MQSPRRLRRALTVTPLLCVVAGYLLRMATEPRPPVIDVDAEITAALEAQAAANEERALLAAYEPTAKVSAFSLENVSAPHANAYGAASVLLRKAFYDSGYRDAMMFIRELDRYGEVAGQSDAARMAWLVRGEVNSREFSAHVYRDMGLFPVYRQEWKLAYVEVNGQPLPKFKSPLPELPTTAH